MFAELKMYRGRFGDCNVSESENQQLVRWVAKQRALQRAGNLSAERKKRLDALGFVWNPHDAAWEIMFAELKRFRKRFRDCNVSRDWPENPKLGRWVDMQRHLKRKGTLLAQRKARLDALGFEWHPNKRRPAAE
jgi:hypothetical protein